MIAKGDRLSERRIGPLTRTDFVRYAGAGGDFNPIHHDETFAAAAGYPSVFGHGLLTAGLLSGYVCDRFGRANLRTYGVRYVAQVWPGDTLVLSGEVTAVEDSVDGVWVDSALQVERESAAGERVVVLRGNARTVHSSSVASEGV